jgi:hypothetical protein
MTDLSAQHLLADVTIAPNGGFKGIGTGPLANPVPGTAMSIFATFISSTLGVITIVAIIWFVFTFITGAIGIISSGGDKQSLESAKKKITYAIIGLVIVIIALFVMELIGFLIGIPNILDLQTLFNMVAFPNGGGKTGP